MKWDIVLRSLGQIGEVPKTFDSEGDVKSFRSCDGLANIEGLELSQLGGVSIELVCESM